MILGGSGGNTGVEIWDPYSGYAALVMDAHPQEDSAQRALGRATLIPIKSTR